MMCTCGVCTIVSYSIGKIEEDIERLRKAVTNGLYDERSIVGDAVLRIEGELRHIREHIPRISKTSNLPKRHPKKIKK